MASLIFVLHKSLTNAQITALYDMAEEAGVGLGLYGDTPSPARDSFRWQITGGPIQIRRFKRRMEGMD
ncbi:hypothetical protein ACFUC2_04840 [[Kitasatospora] papulosa]|uniref:hypothetical protein n=1 Tax=[Kitasatospora] papulosa TaxID=1464011 RepID=UPI003634D327